MKLASRQLKIKMMIFKYFLLYVFSFASFALSDTSKLKHENHTFEPFQRRGAFRTVEGNKIIRMVDASQLPFTIGEEFTNENQQFILVIKNVKKSSISVTIHTNDKNRNLRINQIILPDNSSDGPFSKTMKFKTSKKGIYKIVVGKNLMAEGKLTGNFNLSVE